LIPWRYVRRLRMMSSYTILGVSFLVFPMFFFSGALFPLKNLPSYLLILTMLDPVTYAVDRLRGLLLGSSQLPIALNLSVLAVFAAVMIRIGTWSFKRLK